MFLLILDKTPYKSVELIPNRLKFKQLLELGQLICSAGISDVFKPIEQGKELQKWILNNIEFTFVYFRALSVWCSENLNISVETDKKITKIMYDLYFSCKKVAWHYPKTIVFRYTKEYSVFTEYETNSELPIDIAVEEYKKYVQWKEKQYDLRRTAEKV